MTTAVANFSHQVTKPYIDLATFKSAPTALDYGNLVQGGTQAQQDAELTNAIYRASSWMDQYCGQILSATSDTETLRTRIRPDGTIRIHPDYNPVIAVTDIKMGGSPQNVTSVSDPSKAWLEKQQIVYPYASATFTSQGPLSLSIPASNRQELYVQISYVNGYTNTTLSASVAAAATSVTVADNVGIIAGQWLTIFDGASTERVQVASTYVYGSSLTIPLATAVVYAHTANIFITALPAAIQEACILLTSAILKIRGDASLTLAVTNSPGQQVAGAQLKGSDVAVAQMLLAPFRRIR